MIVAVIFFMTTILSGLILNLLFKKRVVKRRIAQLTDRKKLAIEQEQVISGPDKSSLMKVLENVAKNIRTTEDTRAKIENVLESAAVPLRVEEFITIRITLFVVSIMISLLLGVQFFLSVIVGFLGWRLPLFLVKRKKEKRMDLARSQLPQALEIMASAMKSGFSFMQAMQLVANELPDPIGVEFHRTIKDINFGMPMDIAFENLLKRIPNRDLQIVITAILIQRTTGGNLSQILETIHETITDRVRMKDELKALTSQGRMSAIIITLLPVGLGLLLNMINPNYFTPMLQHPLGWVMIGGGLISGVLGWIFIQKVVTIEV